MNKDFIFFGSDEFSIEVLETLIVGGFNSIACITQPDKPQGRNLKLTPPKIKTFCEEKEIPVLQPENLDSNFVEKLKELNADYFVVASYGKIISKEIITLPPFGALNVHPSILPKYRGASPIETAILNNDKEIGVAIMLMDEKMDHGPVFEITKKAFEEWSNKEEVFKTMAHIGGEMLCEIIPKWINEEIQPKEQNHKEATFTKMIKKTDGEIDISIQSSDVSRQNYLKFIAYNPWPGTFFFIEKNNKKIRVKITEADFVDGKFVIKKVIPEGKKEMDWESFKNGYGV